MARTLTRSRRPLADLVIEEIRVEMARQRLNQSDLARLLTEGQPWVSRRLSGATPMTLDDLERIARALRIDVEDVVRSRERSDTRRPAIAA